MGEDKLQLARCDIMLMIPGYLDSKKTDWLGDSPVCDIYTKAISEIIAGEYKDDFIEDIERHIVGHVAPTVSLAEGTDILEGIVQVLERIGERRTQQSVDVVRIVL